jgi:hypothetical protein
MTTDPATLALLDQARAASAEAVRMVCDRATDTTTVRVGATVPGHGARTVVARLEDRLSLGAVTYCPHIGVMRPAFWVAFAPGKIRCAACAERAHARIRGTDEEFRCDCCGRIRREIHPVTVALHALVIEGEVIPPVILTAGVCEACAESAGDGPELRLWRGGP